MGSSSAKRFPNSYEKTHSVESVYKEETFCWDKHKFQRLKTIQQAVPYFLGKASLTEKYSFGKKGQLKNTQKLMATFSSQKLY